MRTYMKQGYIIFLFIAFFLEGCKYERKDDNRIVYKEYHRELYTIYNNEYDFENLIPNKVCDILFDQITGKIWIHKVDETRSFFQLFEEDGGVSREIVISYKDIIPLLGGKCFINNNIALISASGDLQYICVNLNDETYSIINLVSDTFLYKTISGFSGDYIFTDDCWYDIKERVTHPFPIQLSYPSFMARIDRIIGTNSDGNIVLLNYKNDIYEILPIKRKLKKQKFLYTPECLYYADEDNIYYSKYSKWYPSALYFTFFMDAMEPIKWYRYDKKNGITSLIKSPSEHSMIFGVIK